MKNLCGMLLMLCFLAMQLQGSEGYCTSSTCSLFSSNNYCCSNSYCCSSSQYYALNTATNWLKIGIGAIVGIVIGCLVCLGLSIAGCVYCCCRSNTTSTGTVVMAQPVTMQQYPPGQQYPAGQAYPPGQQYPTGQQQFSPASQYPGGQAPYPTKAPDGPPPSY